MNESNEEAGRKADGAIVVWMIIGMNLGIAVGISVDNLAAGIGIGMGLGVAVGALARRAQLRKAQEATDTHPE